MSRPSIARPHPSVLAPLVAIAWIAACAPVGEPAHPSAGSVSSPPAAAPTPVAPKPPSSASDVLAQGRAPFDACYAHARAAHPDLGRTSVEITFAMDGGGRLTSVELKYRNRFDDASKDCMRQAAEALAFPPSLVGSQVGTIEFAPSP
jgi:hypothetical protein